MTLLALHAIGGYLCSSPYCFPSVSLMIKSIINGHCWEPLTPVIVLLWVLDNLLNAIKMKFMKCTLQSL